MLVTQDGLPLLVNADRVGYIAPDITNPKTHCWVFIGDKSVQVQMPQEEAIRILAQASPGFRSVDNGPLELGISSAQIAEATPPEVTLTGISSGDIHFNGPVSIKVNTDA